MGYVSFQEGKFIPNRCFTEMPLVSSRLFLKWNPSLHKSKNPERHPKSGLILRTKNETHLATNTGSNFLIFHCSICPCWFLEHIIFQGWNCRQTQEFRQDPEEWHGRHGKLMNLWFVNGDFRNYWDENNVRRNWLLVYWTWKREPMNFLGVIVNVCLFDGFFLLSIVQLLTVK